MHRLLAYNRGADWSCKDCRGGRAKIEVRKFGCGVLAARISAGLTANEIVATPMTLFFNFFVSQ